MFNPSWLGSGSVRVGFIFSHSYISACINIRLGLKWKWSANFSIQAREDKWQIKQKRNHLSSRRNKNMFKMNNLHCRSSRCLSVLHARPAGKPSVRSSLLHLRALAMGRVEWGGPGWAAAEWTYVPQRRGVRQTCGSQQSNLRLWARHRESFARGSSPCKWCGSQNSHACQELSKM